MITWTILITIILVTVGLSSFYCFVRHFSQHPQDKSIFYERKTLYEIAYLLFAAFAWAILYKVTLDAYRVEFESLSKSKRLLIQIMFLIAPLGGLNGYVAHLIIKRTENIRLSNYAEKMTKAQKFRRRGKK